MSSLRNTERYRSASPNDMLVCDLFSGLDPERLMIVARSTSIVPISGKQLRQPLHQLAEYVCFVVEGEFQVVESNAETGVYSGATGATLQVGDWWGKIWPSSISMGNNLALLATGQGKLAVMQPARMRRILGDWPDLAMATLKTTTNQQFEMQSELYQLRAKLADTDRILNRVRDVTELLMQGGIGGQQVSETIQRKFELSSLPESLVTPVDIEQFYLDPEGSISEDRVRRISDGKSVKITRTRRMISDGRRREFKSELGLDEFVELERRKVGQLIRKTRYNLADIKGAESVVVDRFHEPKVGLLIMEADFSKAEDAVKWEFPEELEQLLEKEVTDDSYYSNQNIAYSGIT